MNTEEDRSSALAIRAQDQMPLTWAQIGALHWALARYGDFSNSTIVHPLLDAPPSSNAALTIEQLRSLLDRHESLRVTLHCSGADPGNSADWYQQLNATDAVAITVAPYGTHPYASRHEALQSLSHEYTRLGGSLKHPSEAAEFRILGWPDGSWSTVMIASHLLFDRSGLMALSDDLAIFCTTGRWKQLRAISSLEVAGIEHSEEFTLRSRRNIARMLSWQGSGSCSGAVTRAAEVRSPRLGAHLSAISTAWKVPEVAVVLLIVAAMTEGGQERTSRTIGMLGGFGSPIPGAIHVGVSTCEYWCHVRLEPDRDPATVARDVWTATVGSFRAGPYDPQSARAQGLDPNSTLVPSVNFVRVSSESLPDRLQPEGWLVTNGQASSLRRPTAQVRRATDALHLYAVGPDQSLGASYGESLSHIMSTYAADVDFPSAL